MSNQSAAPPEQYTVIASGVHFTLSRAQIEHDSPNYFTLLFLGDFDESKTKMVHLDKDPYLFELITKHLSGYQILPLETKGLASWMSRDLAERNLALDAEYFGLDQLQNKISDRQIGQSTAHDMREYLRWRCIGRTSELRGNPDFITYRLLREDVGTTVGGALSIMARQNEASWTLWDEYRQSSQKG